MYRLSVNACRLFDLVWPDRERPPKRTPMTASTVESRCPDPGGVPQAPARSPACRAARGRIARRLEAILKTMGASVDVDGAGEQVGADTGNLLARIPGTAPGAPPLLLSCAHGHRLGPAERPTPPWGSRATSSGRTGRACSAATTSPASPRSSRRSAWCGRRLDPPRRDRGAADDLRGVRARWRSCHFDARAGSPRRAAGSCAPRRRRRGLELITRAARGQPPGRCPDSDGLEAHAGHLPGAGDQPRSRSRPRPSRGMKLGRPRCRDHREHRGDPRAASGSNIVPNRVVPCAARRGASTPTPSSSASDLEHHAAGASKDAPARPRAHRDGRRPRAPSAGDHRGRAPVRPRSTCRIGPTSCGCARPAAAAPPAGDLPDAGHGRGIRRSQATSRRVRMPALVANRRVDAACGDGPRRDERRRCRRP